MNFQQVAKLNSKLWKIVSIYIVRHIYQVSKDKLRPAKYKANRIMMITALAILKEKRENWIVLHL